MSAYSVNTLVKLRKGLLVTMAVVALGVVSATSAILYDHRQHELHESASAVQSLAMVLSKEADSTLALADTVLSGLIRELNLDRRDGVAEAEVIHNALARTRQVLIGSAEKPSFAHMFILGPDGLNIANSVSYPAKKVNASDRPYFIHHRDRKDSALRISQPHYSKVTQERTIFLTKRIQARSGEFLGIIGMHLKLRHFDHLYDLLRLPPGGTVTIIRKDGWGIYRYPTAPPFFKKSVGKRPSFQTMLTNKSGGWERIFSPYDETYRVAGYHVSDATSLLSIVSVTHASVLDNWLENAVQTAVIAVIGLFFVLGVATVSYRQIGHLIHALNLSTQDSLTELWNRRAFDERLDEEWRRAIRRAHPVSLLFVDVDHFKLFNDEYGHREGDKCLKAIARSLLASYTRGGEFVARYGGEEFVVLLPNAGSGDAQNSAKHLIDTVHGLEIPHAKSSASSFVTVSVGVATMEPVRGDSVEELVERADDALYEAKKAGRNQYASHKGSH